MWKNYLKSAYRNLLKNKSFSIINLLGLATGITACLFIVQYVAYELSYDKFYEGSENIYRISVERYQNNELEQSSAFTVPALGPAIKEKIPGIAAFFRLHSYSDEYVITGQPDGNNQKVFNERGVFFADPAIIPYLSLSMVQGQSDALLVGPSKVVISESAARKYFGEEALKAGEIMGKTLSLDANGMQTVFMEVEGIFEDVPENTHLRFDFLVSHRTITDLYIPEGAVPEEQRLTVIDNSWGPPQWYTYVVLDPLVKAPDIADKTTKFMQDRNKSINAHELYYLQPVSSIHLHSDLKNEPSVNGNINNVRFMMLIALITLLIAWVNYVNLSTAKALERAKEVGLRKVVGASKGQLIRQFLFESLILNVFAVLLALSAFYIGMPYFETLTNNNYSVPFSGSYKVIFFFLAIFTLGAFAAGVYPALMLSKYNPALVLKGKFSSHGKGGNLRKLLVIFQFSLSIAMMVGTIAIYRQNEFMRTKELGINIDRTLVIKGPDILPTGTHSFDGALDVFRNEMSKYERIGNVASADEIPGSRHGGGERGEYIKRMGYDDLDTKETKVINVDHHYFDNLGVELIAGRNFQQNPKSNKNKIILNESALTYLGFKENEQAFGAKLGIAYHAGFIEYEIIGIVSDFHQTSLKNKIEPLAFYSFPGPGYYMIKLNTGDEPSRNMRESISQVEKTFKVLFPGNPFEYFFLDDFFDRQYHSDLRFGKIFSIFAALALIIACMGLFGLSILTVLQRTREIGIRKTFGASINQIFRLLSADFVKLVLLANFIALPLVFWAIDVWLATYPFRTTLSGWLFIIPGVGILIIALTTVSLQTFKAALTNPVKTLRHE